MPKKAIDRRAEIDGAFRHQVEVKLPTGGFTKGLHDMHAFCRNAEYKSRPTRRGLQAFIRWCFKDETVADSFRAKFGGRKIDLS